jgi:hypothetical protein
MFLGGIPIPIEAIIDRTIGWIDIHFLWNVIFNLPGLFGSNPSRNESILFSQAAFGMCIFMAQVYRNWRNSSNYRNSGNLSLYPLSGFKPS